MSAPAASPARKTLADVAGNAGLIEARVRRETGRLVSVYDGGPAGLDITEDRWYTVCEDHGFAVTHSTLATARHLAVSPMTWCGTCIEGESS